MPKIEIALVCTVTDEGGQHTFSVTLEDAKRVSGNKKFYQYELDYLIAGAALAAHDTFGEVYGKSPKKDDSINFGQKITIDHEAGALGLR